jgi:hypothetical protein
MSAKKPAHTSAVKRAGPTRAHPTPTAAKSDAIQVSHADDHELARPRRSAKTGLKALVPSAYRAEGESDPFLHAYKTKWLSKIDFSSDASVESLLLLSFLVLAHDREREAETIANTLIRHIDPRRASARARAAAVTALRISAWLKAKRGVDATVLLDRARLLSKGAVDQNREWLSHEAPREIDEARMRQRLVLLLPSLAGIARWLNDSGARAKAEATLTGALDVARTLMK